MIIMRNNFDTQLEVLNKELVEMGRQCEKAIELAVSAFLENNSEKRTEVFENDNEIDRKERDIEGFSHMKKSELIDALEGAE